MAINYYLLGLVVFLASACEPGKTDKEVNSVIEPAVDVHTYSEPEKARVTHLSLDIEVAFDSKTIQGIASYNVEAVQGAGEIILDVKDLSIDSIWLEHKDSTYATTYQVTLPKSFMGSALHIIIKDSTEKIHIKYSTNPQAAALQWLNPQQTFGKKAPFLFTQGQAILTRTWLPCQDGPGIRYTYDAVVRVPKELLAVMSADNPQSKTTDGIYEFKMDQPIPSYLMALAVGDIEFKEIGPRTGVYAEPGMLDASAQEFDDLEKMVVGAEELYGPYLWGRYDLIVLPPSFPFGGMENPKLTFATPTIIAGDRSLTSLVAHELAHSWSGNLVTNATWNDFWLNEGHTVYIERRIMEALYGKPYSDMLALLGFQDLENTIEDLGMEAEDTHLKLNLNGRDPDEGMNDIAYEKGYLLLRTLEEKVGKEIFDSYLKKYFSDFKFKSISTEQWKAYINTNLLKVQKLEFSLDEWLYAPSLPSQHAIINSDKFKHVNSRLREFSRIARLDRSNTRSWSTHEWLHFIRGLPTDLHISFYEKLDDVYQLSESGNSEILAAWLELSIRNNYIINNQEKLESFLIEVGRRKFLTPLYRALVETDRLELARNIFTKAKDNYHSVASNSIDALLGADPNK